MPEPTPEQLGREAGEAIANAIADNLEAVLLKMADSIATLQAQHDRLHAEHEALQRLVASLMRQPKVHPPPDE